MTDMNGATVAITGGTGSFGSTMVTHLLTQGVSRIHILSRDTGAEAWAEADRIQAGFDPAVVAAVRQRKARMDSVGQARMADA